jgi:hypothetical protein
MFLIICPSFLYTHPPKPKEFNYQELRKHSSHVSTYEYEKFVLTRTREHVDKGQTG